LRVVPIRPRRPHPWGAIRIVGRAIRDVQIVGRAIRDVRVVGRAIRDVWILGRAIWDEVLVSRTLFASLCAGGVVHGYGASCASTGEAVRRGSIRCHCS
jgi:hypothetical protein